MPREGVNRVKGEVAGRVGLIGPGGRLGHGPVGWGGFILLSFLFVCFFVLFYLFCLFCFI